jgi:hypothetical protein
MTTGSHLSRDRALRHEARRFDHLPDVAHGQSLLAELATARCRFGPVVPDRPLALYGAGKLGRWRAIFSQPLDTTSRW